MSITIHPSAIIDDGAHIGEGSRIWHWVHVCGARASAKASRSGKTFRGNKVVIAITAKSVNNVSITDNVTLEKAFLRAQHGVHQCQQPARTHRSQGRIPKHLGSKGATLGANRTIVCGTTIGAYAFVGAGAVASKAVPDFALVGVPARQIGWMSAYGEQLALPLQGRAETTCPHTGARYILSGTSVARLPA
jgi:UDP-2-acetamido-3-amino-2,3-dideoxy-glucuronate N-acetyltransferase